MLAHVTRRNVITSFSLSVILGAAMTLWAPKALADCTHGGRPCTPTEEMAACLHNSVDAYHECNDHASGFVGKAWCFGKYELDFWGCVPKMLK